MDAYAYKLSTILLSFYWTCYLLDIVKKDDHMNQPGPEIPQDLEMYEIVASYMLTLSIDTPYMSTILSWSG